MNVRSGGGFAREPTIAMFRLELCGRYSARLLALASKKPSQPMTADGYRVSRNPENPAGRKSAADGAARRDQGRDGPSPDWLQAAPRSRGQPKASRHRRDRKSTRLNSSHTVISYAVFCLKKKKK